MILIYASLSGPPNTEYNWNYSSLITVSSVLVWRQLHSSRSVTTLYPLSETRVTHRHWSVYSYSILLFHVPYIQHHISSLQHRPNYVVLAMFYSTLHHISTFEKLRASHFKLYSSAPMSFFSFDTAVCLSRAVT